MRKRLGVCLPLRGALRASHRAARNGRTVRSSSNFRACHIKKAPLGTFFMTAAGRIDAQTLRRLLTPSGRAARVPSRFAQWSNREILIKLPGVPHKKGPVRDLLFDNRWKD